MKDFLTIDKTRLDRELEDQPNLYHNYAVKLADATNAMEKAKSNLDLVEAEVDLDIRSHPDKFKIIKITETLIDKMIRLSKKYQEAKDVYLKAKHLADTLEAAVKALDSKKRSLEGLVQLYLRDFFSEPRIPKESEVERSVIRKPLKRKEQE